MSGQRSTDGAAATDTSATAGTTATADTNATSTQGSTGAGQDTAGKSQTTATNADDNDLDGDSWIANSNLTEDQKKYIAKLKSQNMSRKEKLKEVEGKLSAKEQAEADAARQKEIDQGNWKAVSEADQAKAKKLEERLLREHVKNHAIKEGIVDPSIIDVLTLEGVEYTDGDIKGGEKFIKALKKDKGYMFGEGVVAKKDPEGTTSSTTTTPNPNTTATKINALTMTDAEYKIYEAKELKKEKSRR